MLRHAYLITAYTDPNILRKLISNLLKQNANGNVASIYIMLDKSKNLDELKLELSSIPNVNVYNNFSMYWGSCNFIDAILFLLTESFKNKYDYYHFVTGNDFLIKKPNEILDFFEKNKGFEFIDFNPSAYKFAYWKCNYYHFFVNNSFYHTNKILKIANHSCIKLQKILGFNRKRTNLYHGSSYFSITNKFVEIIQMNTNKIIKEYKYTLACDEVWIQTLFKEYENQGLKLYCNNLRYIDWKRKDGNSPRTFDETDYDMLVHTEENMLFVRKITEKKSMKLVNMLEKYIKEDE